MHVDLGYRPCGQHLQHHAIRGDVGPLAVAGHGRDGILRCEHPRVLAQAALLRAQEVDLLLLGRRVVPDQVEAVRRAGEEPAVRERHLRDRLERCSGQTAIVELLVLGRHRRTDVRRRAEDQRAVVQVDHIVEELVHRVLVLLSRAHDLAEIVPDPRATAVVHGEVDVVPLRFLDNLVIERRAHPTQLDTAFFG